MELVEMGATASLQPPTSCPSPFLGVRGIYNLSPTLNLDHHQTNSP